VLDHLLVNAALAAGAELREGFHIQELLMEGEQVTGIRGRHIQGKPVTEKATFVIGADGMRSVVACAVQAPTYQDRPVFCCTYYAYWSGISLEGVEIYPRDHRTVITFPTQEAFADYEQRRNEMVLPLYELNCQIATLEPPPPTCNPFSVLCVATWLRSVAIWPH
jgi:hypothetical protein